MTRQTIRRAAPQVLCISCTVLLLYIEPEYVGECFLPTDLVANIGSTGKSLIVSELKKVFKINLHLALNYVADTASFK